MTYYAKIINGEVAEIVSSQKDFTQLQPYQQEMWVKMNSGKQSTKRFQLFPGAMNFPAGNQGLGAYGLMIEDFAWWMDNERDILNWMVDTLPQGIDHLQGMFLYFPTDRDRIGFLLKWS